MKRQASQLDRYSAWVTRSGGDRASGCGWFKATCTNGAPAALSDGVRCSRPSGQQLAAAAWASPAGKRRAARFKRSGLAKTSVRRRLPEAAMFHGDLFAALRLSAARLGLGRRWRHSQAKPSQASRRKGAVQRFLWVDARLWADGVDLRQQRVRHDWRANQPGNSAGGRRRFNLRKTCGREGKRDETRNGCLGVRADRDCRC